MNHHFQLVPHGNAKRVVLNKSVDVAQKESRHNMDSNESKIARECIAVLRDMPEEWKPLSEIPEAAEIRSRLSVLTRCGFCEVEQEYTVRFLDGSDTTVRLRNHGNSTQSEGALHAEVKKLLADRLPDGIDTDTPIAIRPLSVRPTSVGQCFRQKYRGGIDETAVVEFLAMFVDPPPYSAEGFHVVPIQGRIANEIGVKYCCGIFVDWDTYVVKRTVPEFGVKSAMIANYDQQRLFKVLIDSDGMISQQIAIEMFPENVDRDNLRRAFNRTLECLHLRLKPHKWIIESRDEN
jgi:hypothetical protein